MRLSMSVEDAKRLLSKALNASVNGCEYEVSEINWSPYATTVEFELVEAVDSAYVPPALEDTVPF
jgi:hypothetical protein